MKPPTPQPLETDGPANGSQGPAHQITGSLHLIHWVLHPTSQLLPPTHTHTHWVLDLHVLTMGSPTTQLMDPDNLTTGAHRHISAPRPQLPQAPEPALGPRSPSPLADPRSPGFQPWISNLGHWILDIKKPQPPDPDSAMPRSGGPSHWIPGPLTPTTGFLNSFTLTLSPGSLCFDYWIPYISTTTPSTPNHWISDSQALSSWILASKSTM